MIPNAPSIINSGYNPVYYSSALPSAEKKEIESIFQTLGQCPEVVESKLEAYAIITAMGPTYFWFQLEELYNLGISFGLSEQELSSALEQMITGTIKVLYNSGLSYKEVIDLIPVKPLADDENSVRELYRSKLNALYQKLKS